MMTETTIEDALQAWAESVVTPAIVIIANQSEPKPDTPFLTLSINGIRTVAHDHESGPDASNQQTTSGPRVIVVEFQSYGVNALGLLDQLKTSLDKISTTELLEVSDLSILNSGSVNNITTSLETKFEKRGSLECRFAIGSSEVDVIDVIETVNITGTNKNPAGDDTMVSDISI